MKRFLIIALAILLLAGCQPNNADDVVISETQAVYGGVLNLSMSVSDTLNPLLAAPKTVRDGLFAVYEPLIAVTADQELRPVLAESWNFNADATVLTVKLKEGILWHDGTEFTAKDVVYTVNTIKNTSGSPYSHLLRYVSAVIETGRHVVTFNLSRSYSQLLYSLYFPIIPINAGSLDEAAIGTGPFMFESYNPGQSLTLVRFDGYRDGSAGFDKVVFSLVRESITIASAFSTGVTNAVQSDVYSFDEFSVRDNCEVKRACGSAFEYLGLNYRSPIFNSVAVRGAISSALNREEIALDGYGAAATAANLPMHPYSLSYSPSLSLIDYNSAGAREALFYDGWTDPNGNGILSKRTTIEDEDGNETSDFMNLKFNILVNSENRRRTMAANIIATQLEESGFTVGVEEVDFEEYMERIESGDFDVYLGGTDIGNLYDLEFLLSSRGEQNYYGYSSDYMDTALETLAQAADDESFENACSIVQEVFIREQPIVGVAFLDDSLILSNSIAGGTMPLFMSPFGNVGKWFYSE